MRSCSNLLSGAVETAHVNMPRPVSPRGNAPAPRRGVLCANLLNDFPAALALLHSASDHARQGHHPRAFAEITEANRLSTAPLIRAYRRSSSPPGTNRA